MDLDELSCVSVVWFSQFMLDLLDRQSAGVVADRLQASGVFVGRRNSSPRIIRQDGAA